MRILVLFGNHRSAESEVMTSSGPEVLVTLRPTVTIRKGDVEVRYFVARTESDADRLRGQRFDLVIEDGSFNPERSHEKGRLLALIRWMVLR